ncbi:MAG: macrolide ABC transporter ATP-binding protein [Candidatus Aenigmarchaeota archaeon CG_4_10_14_0_8_um_filter_37_24]|nr:ABC transporter ATP-binding protein [Candidatus Aenigmarchaeota archaeon]OIN85262.1 MAG: macrolide ABC transporter ATP-binding protein [Candidatus Aenigmarchaeota archaeon CG1_02_38_14]PIV69172.1 MAG: macrolide ABC transporter ATP-binding protein [Candidatus Aenigmarchaeota archaeon CG01_land_8_20_14_3_00_37_9]PIW40998.1 MAG: macrolide ABC transporter ATP-binding protein [Candidatus Aenigmarchaeota archaeon CG15_BIG_FIL_POST_REV_8_21_14_020_37_27]PIX50263.1 MAG: macrolide ABC transporter ATP
MNDIIIETKDLCKYYNQGKSNEVKAIEKINIKINRGDFAALIGPSGSGKSTLLHMIGLLDRTTCGKIFFDGKDISEFTDDELTKIRREKVGFVFQQFNLIPLLTAIENVELPMLLDGMEKEQARGRAEKLLNRVGLGDRLYNRPPDMSGGEQQRVAIARALANNPEVVMADEPTGNLDTKTGKEVLEVLKNAQKKDFTLIIITHDPKIAIFAKKRIELKDGRVINGGE